MYSTRLCELAAHVTWMSARFISRPAKRRLYIASQPCSQARDAPGSRGSGGSRGTEGAFTTFPPINHELSHTRRHIGVLEGANMYVYIKSDF